MVDLILRPSGLPEVHDRPWSLQLRTADLGGTNYSTLCQVNDSTAQLIIDAGKPYWLYGEPNWDERVKAKALERARVLEEKAAALKAKYGSG